MNKLWSILPLLLLPIAAHADLGDLLAPSLNAGGDAVNRLIAPGERMGLLDYFDLWGLPVASSQNLQDGLEAVIHAKGTRFNLTTPATAASWLEGSTGPGALFELEAARFLEVGDGKIVFTGAGNPGVDLRLTQGPGEPVSFFQAKAWQDARAGAKETFLDGLTFAGGEPATCRVRNCRCCRNMSELAQKRSVPLRPCLLATPSSTARPWCPRVSSGE